jgi:hypothetical protein
LNKLKVKYQNKKDVIKSLQEKIKIIKDLHYDQIINIANGIKM